MHKVTDEWERARGSSLEGSLRGHSRAEFEGMKETLLGPLRSEAATLEAEMNAYPGGMLGYFGFYQSNDSPGWRLWKVPEPRIGDGSVG